ncbi:porin [Candidatus Manganitrophus noduliformans]|uniref:Porin n=1 Tax=Candidatus Manganitrophus noduliformans TaxID=2606439 RepID=A0A7X6DLX7_9BACT|nr:porin [Candidatus Manganitrophus noduliformans]NKE69318.1 porin [Candidatus Manganitrophus noduliformans]
MKKTWGAGFVVLFLILSTGRLFAQEPAESPFQISGFVDTYYSFNFNRPDSNTNGLSNFDFYHNAFSVSLAEIVLARTAEPVGFRIDLNFGTTTDFVHCGAFSCPGGASEEPYKNIQQAYVTWATPVGLTLDMGKFVTHMGLEVIESKDNWNYTRGLLFCCAIPYYHAGLRANYAISDMIWVNGYVLNGWNNVVENNNGKTFGAQVGIVPIQPLTVILNWIGPERSAGGGFQDRHVYDAIVMFNATDNLSFAANYDYGTQDPIGGGDSMTWSGIALYARLAADPYAVAVRVENATDDDGVMFGTADNTVQEVTVTGEVKVANNLLIRAEYRYDMADEDIFEDEGGAVTDTQNRAVLGVVYSF